MQRFLQSVFLIILSVFALSTYAADPPATLQNSVERYNPGKTANEIQNQQTNAPETPEKNVINIKGKKLKQPGNQATVNIKFHLKKIVLSGNTVFSTDELSKLYKDKLNTDVSLADIEVIAQKITDYYRNAGYVLTQAVIPPQEIDQKGVVKINIIEGYINKVSISGAKTNNVYELLKAYGSHIAESAPLKLDRLERYSFLATDIPGVTARVVLTPSKTATGASDLTFIVDEKRLGGFVAFNDYNPDTLGRQQYIGNVYVNNLTLASETALNGILGRIDDRMRYGSITHRQQLNSYGLGTRILVSNINTNPDMGTIGLGGDNIPGKAFTASINFDYAWLRSHSKNLYLSAGFEFLNSTTEFAGATLFKDNIRSLIFALTYNFLMGANNFNTFVLTYTQGLNFLDATDNPPSRIEESLTFPKIELYISNSHKFGASRFSSFLALKGQYAFQVVPSAETFTYGGIPFGSGYDASEFAGDQGIAGLLELQYNGISWQCLKLKSQLFAFGDFGFVWDINKTVPPTHQAGASAGAGIRVNTCKHINVDFMAAQPLVPSTIEGTPNYTRFLFNIKLYA